MTTLIVGTGYVGTVLAAHHRSRSIEVVRSSRVPGKADVLVDDVASLDVVLRTRSFDQIVVLGQLTAPHIDWVLDRVDGPRWLVMSSQQVASATPAPGNDQALLREKRCLEAGACVLRPTMVFGRGGDRNVTRMLDMLTKWHIPLVPGSGSQHVQPLHVDDLCELVARHGDAPVGGLFPVGGAEALPLQELIATLAELVGVRLPRIEIPPAALRLAVGVAPLVGLRSDQVLRMFEPKTASNALVCEAFGWQPEPLGVRLEEAALQRACH